MKFISYLKSGNPSIGLVLDKDLNIVDIPQITNGRISSDMKTYLENFESNNSILKKMLTDKKDFIFKIEYDDILAPINNPTSFRDFYAFRQHVEAGRKSRGLEMIPEYDEIPVFYFSNHNAISGPGSIIVQKEHLKKLDFELEIGLLISKNGKNIKAKDAYNYVAGLVILNDWSARSLQAQEMKLNLGPAKGKDFATSIGPYLVTLDELESNIVGKKSDMVYDLDIKGYLNTKLICKDNLKNISWNFSDMIERASYGVELFSGDLIGSGTCSTGCLLELNLTNSTNIWLKEGDVVDFTIDKLGKLSNSIVSG